MEFAGNLQVSTKRLLRPQVLAWLELFLKFPNITFLQKFGNTRQNMNEDPIWEWKEET